MLEYLKRVGFALNDNRNDVIIKRNFRFPTLSCRLADSVIVDDDNNALVFVLSYFVSDDFAKQQVEFSFDEWNDKGLDADAFLKVKRDVPQLFDFFSIQNSLLNRIFVSRLHGRKAYKKRNFPLAIKWARVKKEFGVIDNTNAIGGGVSGVVVDSEINNKIVYFTSVMQNCVKKAAESYSYMPFELYFDSYKKLKRLNGIIENNFIHDAETSKNVSRRTSRNLVFKEFVGKVNALQKGC